MQRIIFLSPKTLGSYHLIFSFLLIVSFVHAQNIDFIHANPQPNLVDVYGGSFASGDIDGDGDNDLFMAGITPARRTRLYTNDGLGNFTEVGNTPFPDASESQAILKDLDGDGDLDLFFAGNGSGIQEFAHIYLNNGLGTFTLLANPLLPVFADSGIDIADVDKDGDPDILIAVLDANGNFIADIFLNNGSAIFTPAGNTTITPVRFGAIEFIDVENDSDFDVIIGGEDENGDASTKLYINDGMGNYNLDSSNSFIQLSTSDIDAADTDNDGDLDILMSGTTDQFEVRTILYLNNGNGQFTELSNSNLQQTFGGTNAIADLDNDGDQDILIVGSQEGGLPNIFNIVYENIGNNQFIPVDTLGGEYIAACLVDNFNGDDLVDIIIQGFADKTNVYWNNSTPPMPNCPIDNVWVGTSGNTWNDANNWSLSEIPTACHHVIIPSGSNVILVSGNVGTAYSLTVFKEAIFETEQSAILDIIAE